MGTLPLFDGLIKVSMSIGTPLLNKSWFIPDEYDASLLASSSYVDLGSMLVKSGKLYSAQTLSQAGLSSSSGYRCSIRILSGDFAAL